MPEGTSNSVVNLGDLTKPADTLIKKISKAVGGLFEPWQTKRIAKANAEAAIIEAQTEIQITQLHQRAVHRFINEEAQRQQNIEDITAKALPELNATATPESIEDDWITNFFDKSRIVSNSEMQYLWAKVLVGEANKPGTYSKRTVNFLSDLDKYDAELFSKLVSFSWNIGKLSPLIFDYQEDFYTKRGIDLIGLRHLDSIGLIQFDGIASFSRTRIPKHFTVSYFGRSLRLDMPEGSENRIDIGQVILTKVGEELAPIASHNPVEGLWEYVRDKWKDYSPGDSVQTPATSTTNQSE